MNWLYLAAIGCGTVAILLIALAKRNLWLVTGIFLLAGLVLATIWVWTT